MGKQVFEIHEDLIETHEELKEVLGEKNLLDFNIKFQDENQFHESVRNYIKDRNLETSKLTNEEVLGFHSDLFNNSKNSIDAKKIYLRFSKVAVVTHFKNPVFIITENQIHNPSSLLAEVSSSQLDFVKAAIKLVGRIEHPNHYEDSGKWSGTGWIYGSEGYVITNAHVVESFVDSQLNFKKNYQKGGVIIQPYLNLKAERGDELGKKIKLDKVCYIGEKIGGNHYPDIAILKFDISQYDFLENGLQLQKEELTTDQIITTIGHPDDIRDIKEYNLPRECHKYINEIFNDNAEGKKKLSIGKIISYNSNGYDLKHTCSTLHGNSGGPLINPLTGKVLGMNTKGDYTNCKYNKAVTSSAIQKIINEKLT